MSQRGQETEMALPSQVGGAGRCRRTGCGCFSASGGPGCAGYTWRSSFCPPGRLKGTSGPLTPGSKVGKYKVCLGRGKESRVAGAVSRRRRKGWVGGRESQLRGHVLSKAMGGHHRGRWATATTLCNCKFLQNCIQISVCFSRKETTAFLRSSEML